MMSRMYKRGATLVELLLYIAIITMLLAMVVSLYFAIAHARMKQQTISEVEVQGLLVINSMTQAIRNALSVTLPATSTTASSLSLVTYTSSTTPTLFATASSTLSITEGSSTSTALTSSQVVISNLTFQNLSASGTLGSIKIQFTMAHATTSGSYDSSYSATFYGAASVHRIKQQ